MQLERRTLRLGELRAAEDSIITGYAAVFNSPTDIGGMFREVVAPGAFTDAVKRDDVRALINHDSNLVLGRTTAGTLRLSENERGLRVEIDPPDTQYARDLLVSMKRGDVSQMSFGFEALVQTWDESGDVLERTLDECRLFDVSIVTYPAYEDTEAEANCRRSLELWRADRPKFKTPEGLALRSKMFADLAARGL